VEEPLTSLERERKFEVSADLSIPSLIGIAGVAEVSSPQQHQLVAHYFDTAHLDLAQSGRILRHRSGGHDAGWHIKQRTGDGVLELQWPVTVEGFESIPDQVVDAVKDVSHGQPLAMVATISTLRTVTMLHLNSAAPPIAELADDVVSSTDHRTGVTKTWREWEIELLNAPEGDAGEAFLDQVEQALCAVGAKRSKRASKLQHGLSSEQ
jgi:hypothetical protein